MAVSAVAGLVSAIGAAATGLTVFGLAATSFAGFAAAFALGAGLSMVSRALAPKPNLGAQLRGITQTTREPAGPRQIIYGQMRVGGQVVFIGNSGDDNTYLHLVIVFASHEIESFEEFWFNDNRVYDNGAVLNDWQDVVTVTTFDGSQTAADSTLTSQFVQWTSNHVLNDMAYAHFRLKWDQDKFPQGVPNITAKLKGKKVYDPRDSGQSATDDTTWTYSQNPALCVRDYLVDKKYGLGEDHTLIDETALTAAANLCDEDVALDGGGTQDRYRCNGVLNTENQIKSNIEQILSAMGGRVSYSGGKYYIDAAGYVAPTIEFTEADCVSDIQTQTKQSRRGVYNGVKGIFVSEEKNYKVLDYPAQISSTYEAEDGEPIYLDMPLPFVTNNRQAQRLAKIALLKSRQQVVVTMTVNLKGLQVKVGDTIKLTNERLGYDEKIFEVIDYSLAITAGGNLAVNLQLIETAAAIYDWTTSDEQDFLSGGELDLYDGRTVDNVTNLTATEIVTVGPDGNATTSVELTWTAPDDAFIDFYKVRWNKVGTTDYFHAETKETRILITGLDVTSNYDFRVQVQNLLGVTSTGVSLNDEVLEGDTTAPAVPTVIGTEGGIQTITFTWNNPSDIDFKHVEVFVNNTNSLPASPTSIVDGETYTISGLIGEQTRYFWLKSVDFSGNKSAATTGVSGTSVKVTAGDIEDGAIDIASFASDISPVQIVSTLPTTASQGDLVFLTTDNNLYRYTGTQWTRAIALVDVDGAGDLAALDTVGSSQIDNDAITDAKIAVDAITADVIAAGAITTTKIADDAISTAKIAAGAVTAGEIAAGAVTATAIQAGTITASEIAANTITGNQIAAAAIAADEIAAGAVTTAKIAANAVTANEIAANTITSNEIAANTITAGQIAAGAIGASEISVTELSAISSVLGTLTAGTIDASNVDITNLTVNNLVGDVTTIDTFTATNVPFQVQASFTRDMVSIASQTHAYRPFITINATAQLQDNITVWGELQMRENVSTSKSSIGTVSASAAAFSSIYYSIPAYVVLPTTSTVRAGDLIGLTTDTTASYKVTAISQVGSDLYVYVTTTAGAAVTTAPPTGPYSKFAQTQTWVTVSKSYVVERSGPSWKPMSFQGALPNSTTNSVDVRVVFYRSSEVTNSTATPPTTTSGTKKFGIINIQGVVMLAR